MSLAAALDDTEQFLCRYVKFSDQHQPVVIALWSALTHCFEQFEIVPYLSITSPTKRSGKSLLLDVLRLLVARPWGPQVQPSPAVTFRKIDRDQPTLLLDEVDTIFKRGRDYEELRAILNAGYRAGAEVSRVSGEKFQLQSFKVFCPKVLAGIGRLPDTVADRSIPIRLKRRSKDEGVERFRYRHAKEEASGIHDSLVAAVVDVPAEGAWLNDLNDRAADNWEPLLAIADAAGGAWPDRARAAALALSGEFDADEETLGVRLLADIHTVFADHDKMFTSSLVTVLCDIEDAPWADLGGKPLTANKVARMLKPFEVRSSGTIRVGTATGKGYMRSSFDDAWNRYLTTEPTTAIAERDGVTVDPPSAEGDIEGPCHKCGYTAKHLTPGGVLWCDPCMVADF